MIYLVYLWYTIPAGINAVPEFWSSGVLEFWSSGVLELFIHLTLLH